MSSSKHSKKYFCNLGIHGTLKQKSIKLQHYPPTNDSESQQPSTTNTITTTPWHLEQLMDKYLEHPEEELDSGENEEQQEEYVNPVKLFLSEDAHLLKCRHCLDKHNTHSVFGIWENTSLFLSKEKYEEMALKQQNGVMQEEDIDVNINLSLYKVSPNALDEDGDAHHHSCYNYPKGDWSRRRLQHQSKSSSNSNGTTKSKDDGNIQTANLTIVDFTPIQKQRRRIYQQCKEGSQPQDQQQLNKEIMTWNTPGRICQLLRSILIGDHDSLHCASPWSHAYETQQQGNTNDDYMTDSVIGILVYRGIHEEEYDTDNVDSFCSELEQEEYNEIVKFRTGDAVPSYYLHSCSHIEVPMLEEKDDGDGCDAFLDDFILLGSKRNDEEGERVTPHNSHRQLDDGKSTETRAAALLIYRLIPPRDHLSPYPPQQTTVKVTNDDETNTTRNVRSVTPDGCLWETYHTPSNTVEGELEKQHRKVAPPYINVEEEYPGLMDHFLTTENFKAMQEEALRIPQWTAWPERQHYRTTLEDSDGEEGSNEGTSAYPASWTVFPLCHTFPAYNVSNRKFIASTCSFAPQTTQLLLSLGSKLRTALFSRLDPQTVLSAHTGWEDLANHVLRVHIPLVVPKNVDGDDTGTNSGLCGTWVDGCVETHEEGHLICFDDSKTHRAFNYAKEERIVLIVDLERNVSCQDEKDEEGNVVNYSLPLGTATGGHTEELDNFINQLT